MQDAPWGRQARAALGDFLDWSRRVQCHIVDHDAHKHPVARCVTTGPGAAGGKNLVIWLLERGWAVADRDVTQAPGAVSTHLLGICIYGFSIARQLYYTFGWKAHGDGGADANFALQVQVTAMHLDK